MASLLAGVGQLSQLAKLCPVARPSGSAHSFYDVIIVRYVMEWSNCRGVRLY